MTLKIRTGWDREQPQRACSIARIAEPPASQALAVHGRTRACGYSGEAEYDTIARDQGGASRIPVIANGDIDSPGEGARRCSMHTGADG